MIIGLILGLIISFVSDSYYNLLTSSNKVIYKMLNGTIDSSVLFWNKLLVFLVPLILFFLCSLNYYSSFLQVAFVVYQSTLLVLSCSAIVLSYGFSGVLNILFVTLPVNLLYFAVLIFYGVTNMSRSKMAFRYKNFLEGFNQVYFIKTLISVLSVLILCFIACVIYPVILHNVNFIIF